MRITSARSLDAIRHRAGTSTADQDLVPLAGPAVVLGTIMVAGALIILILNRLPGWASDYGRGLVYFAFFLYATVAARLLWWGIGLAVGRSANRESAGAGDRHR